MTAPADPTAPDQDERRTVDALATALSPSARRALVATEGWLHGWIVGLGLCPFAGPALARRHLRIAVCEQQELEGRLQDFARELSSVMDPGHSHRTTLLVLDDPVLSLEDFLDLLSVADVLVADEGLEHMVQLVGFHPHQRYADGTSEDAAAYATRAPFPTLHILLEVDVAQAVEEHPDVSRIPDDNAVALEGLGASALARQLMAWRRGEV